MASKKHGPKVSDEDAARKAMMDATKAIIKKATGQDPIGASSGTWPHLPTGAISIDNLIGGTPLADGSGLVCPGYPRGRITEIYGAESSGKTTLALGGVVQAQKLGQAAMYLDFENAVHHGYARSIGVDFDESLLQIFAPTTFEEGLKMLYVAIRQGFGIVVIDSVAAMVPQGELNKELDAAAAVGALARGMSTNLPKMTQWLKTSKTAVIFINQVRSLIQKTNYGPGDDNTAGGKAVKFYASLRLKLTRIKSEFVERLDPLTLKKKRIPYGNVTQVKAVKNRMDAKQGHTGEIFIRYGYGVDEYLSLIEGAIPRKIIVKKGSAYEFAGESFKGRDRLRTYLINNPLAFEDVKKKVTASLLSEAPHVIEGEVEDEDIMSDLRKEIGDDDLMDQDPPEGIEEVVLEGS
jgi:recombination protein RecA